MTSPVYPPDPEFDPQRVLIFFAQGYNSWEIGHLLGMAEDEVADILARDREDRYQQRQQAQVA